MLKAILLLLFPLSLLGEATVPGPFKETALPPDVEQDAITLTYRASKRASNQWVDTVREDGSKIRLCVDVGLVGYGVEAYLSLDDSLVVLDAKSRQALWMNSVGAWYRTLSFKHAKEAGTAQELTLVRVAGRSGPARYFELRTGHEEFIEMNGEALVAHAEAKQELRGKPVRVLKSLAGEDSRVTKPRCERITSGPAWTKLWNEHASSAAVSPEIDFSREMAVAVFLGEAWNCKGVEVVQALDCEEAIELFVRGCDYQTMGKADRVCPYGIFVLPKSPKRLMVKANSQAYIGGPPLWTQLAEFKSEAQAGGR